MKVINETYVRYVGIYRPSKSPITVPVESRVIEELDIPSGTAEFTFFDRTTVILDDGRMFIQESNVSPPFKAQIPEHLKHLKK